MNRPEYAVEIKLTEALGAAVELGNEVNKLRAEMAAAHQSAVESIHSFKNFHRQLCERFGYGHDEVDWQRDQVSLIEHIAKQALSSGTAPTVTDGGPAEAGHLSIKCPIDKTCLEYPRCPCGGCSAVEPDGPKSTLDSGK